jgi:hypothetical protein
MSITHLLPDDAYPADPATGEPMPAEKRADVDRRLSELLEKHPLPTEPGEYVDGTGDHWILDAQGGWTDHHGMHRNARYAPIIALLINKGGPFIRIQEVEQ